MQGGSFGKNASTKQLIPTEKLFKELSNNEAKKIVDTLNSIKDGTNAAFTSMDDYLSYLDREGKGYIKNYVKENQNQVYVTDDVIDASKRARAEQIAYNATIKQSTLAFKAASIAKRIFATIGNMAVMWALSKAIGAVTDTIGELVHSEENLRQSASELGSELSNNASDIDSYKKKIDELKTVINDSSSSFDEVSQARVDLMAVQDELIEKFGTEKGVIENITSAINDQTDALDELGRRSYFQAKNEFNEKTGGDKFADWLSFGNTNDDRIQSNMDKMVDTMRSSFYELETTGNTVLDNLIAKSYDLNIVDDMYGDGRHFQIYGTLDEIQAKLYGIQQLSQDFELSTAFENSFTKISNDVDDALVKYKNLYDQYVLYEKILTDNPDNQYDEQFDLINKAKEAFNEATKLGDTDKIKEASDTYAQTLQSAVDMAMQNSDYDVADYFKNMYPELKQMFGEWQFELNFEPSVDGLQNKLVTLLDRFDGNNKDGIKVTAEELKNFNPNTAREQDQISIYAELCAMADHYGMSIDALIDKLQKMGLIQSESYQQLVDTFGQDNVDKLSAEDIKIAFTIENAGNMTFEQLQTEIQKTKELANETGISPLTISQTIDQLNTQLKPAMDSLNSAWNEIFSDDEFKLNSIDILSTCDSIKSKMDEMKELGLDVDYSAFENFVSVLNNTESKTSDVDKAFDSLADSIAKAALTGAEDFDTMKAALEDLGVVNSDIIAFQELINNTTALEEAVTQAGLTMSDFVVHTEDGSIAATDAAKAFIEEIVGAKNCQQALALLQLQQMLCNENSLNTTDDINACLTLAKAAGVAAESLSWLANVSAQYDKAVEIGDTVAQQNLAATMKSIKERFNKELADFQPNAVDFSGVGKNAKSAGKKAGKDYKDALKEQLSNLDSVISGITSRIDDQISSINEQKSAALESIDAQKEALESAKEAAIEALEAQRDAQLAIIEEQKKALEDKIKIKQDEIKAIEDAAEARKREIDLQKAQYELERMQNQRTKLVYTESEGLVYKNDSKNIRDAKEKVDEAKRQIEIANLEKEKELLEYQVELLDERIDAINEYYDNLIEQTEKSYDAQIKVLEKQRKETESYFESLIKNLESSKTKYQELTEILEKAELSAKLKQLGIDEEALLNGSEEEFNKLKDAYMNIVFQLNEGNDEVLNSLRELSGYEGSAPSMLEDSNTKLGTMNDELSDANTEVGNVNSSLSETASTTSTVATNVGTVVDELNQLPESEKVSGLSKEFETLAKKIGEVAKALGIGEGEAVGTLCKAMSDLNTVTLGSESEGIIGQFTLLKQAILDVIETIGSSEAQTVGSLMAAITQLNSITLDESIIKQFTSLKTVIDSVTAAISGGGGESSEGEGSGSKSAGGKSGSQGSKGNGESGGGDSLTGAIESMGETAQEVIGEPDAEGDGTVIGEFGSMETAVNDVRDAIGTEGSEGGEGGKSGSGGKGESDDTLVGSIEYLGDKTEEEMGESGGDGIISRFEQFENVIGEAEGHVQGISKGLDSINGKEVECTIKINIIRNESGGGGGDSAAGESQLLGSMNLDSATYNAKYKGNAHVSGTANVTGDWGVRNPGKTLVGEMGQELWVHAKDSTFETVGDNGAEFITTESGDLIFNHLQTKELLSKGNIVGRGRALASGTALANGTANSAGDGVTVLADGTVLRPLQPGDPMYDMMQKFDAYFKSMDGNLEKLVPNSFYDHQKQMENMVKQITNNSIVNNTRNVQQPVHQTFNITMPNVTDSTSAQTLMNDLQSLATKKYQVNW